MSSRSLVAAAVAAALVQLLLVGCGHAVGKSPTSELTAPGAATSMVATTSPEPIGASSSVLPGLEVDLERVAQRFVRFARGELDSPPADTPVGMYLGGALARTIESHELAERARWEGICPHPAGYAGRTCPFSVLEPLQTDEGGMRIATQPVQSPCAHPTPLVPSDVGATHLVTIVPRPRGSCLDWVAVELFVNDVSQVVAVNVVWAEP